MAILARSVEDGERRDLGPDHVAQRHLDLHAAGPHLCVGGAAPRAVGQHRLRTRRKARGVDAHAARQPHVEQRERSGQRPSGGFDLKAERDRRACAQSLGAQADVQPGALPRLGGAGRAGAHQQNARERSDPGSPCAEPRAESGQPSPSEHPASHRHLKPQPAGDVRGHRVARAVDRAREVGGPGGVGAAARATVQ